MSSVQALREFINERLTAAAGEIFTVFEQTIVQYEEEIVRQRRLLETRWNPQIKLHRTELQQHHDCREEQLCDQETNYCLEQEEPEPPQIKEEQEEGLIHSKEEEEEPEPSQIEEHEELSTGQDKEQLIMKFEGSPSIEEQIYLSEPEEVPEQFFSRDSEVHGVKKHMDPESTLNAELKKICIFHSDRGENFPVSEKQAECGKTVYKTTFCHNLRTLTDMKKIICEVCHKSYNRPNDLKSHMRTHTGEKPYSCETCGKTFSKQSNFLRHMKTHTGEKPYSCKICGKRYTQRGNLLAHMRTHTGEKPYSCATCGKCFCKQSNFLRHTKTHTGEKPYSCQICGKSFSQQHHLMDHIRTHTGEKPYSCKTCRKSFSRQSHLLRHMRTHKEMKS